MTLQKKLLCDEYIITTVKDIKKCDNKECFYDAQFSITFSYTIPPVLLCKSCIEKLTLKLKQPSQEYKQQMKLSSFNQ